MIRKNVALLITVLLVLTVPIFTAYAQGESNAAAGTTILLVRHGETDWNALGYLQGWADTTLNASGLSEVEELGAKPSNIGLQLHIFGHNVHQVSAFCDNRVHPDSFFVRKGFSLGMNPGKA
jgi:hypothetical protein